MQRLPQWPGYLEQHPRARTLALLEGHTLQTPEETHEVQTWEEIKALAFRYDPVLEVYVNQIAGSWWFLEAANDPQVKMLASSQAIIHSWNMVASLYIQKGRQRVWIVAARTWDTPTATPTFLAYLSTLFNLCGVGVRPTPGSLGQAIMRECWRDEKRRWVSRPLNHIRQTLLKHVVGGRVDYFVTPKKRFQKVFETDLSGAYASVCDRLPGGAAVAFCGNPPHYLYTYFVESTVRVPAPNLSAFGIFAIPSAAGNEYPNEPGEYHVWLWKEEVDLCRRNGWLVIEHGGWGWMRWETGLSVWAQRMYLLRVQAQAIDSTLSAWIKQATVAAIGRFGMPLWSWMLLKETDPRVQNGDMALLDGLEETGWALHRLIDGNSNHLTHWYSYILMRARLVLRARMLWEYHRGNDIFMSNYDALYCRLPADPLTLGEGLGNWKQTELHDVSFPFPRGIISREKTTLPGVTRKKGANA